MRLFLSYIHARVSNFCYCFSFNRLHGTEDIEVAPDFFSYMAATQWLLWEDPTIMCVSAWNDNGSKKHVKDPSKTPSVVISSLSLPLSPLQILFY
jgi:hypothetical protein